MPYIALQLVGIQAVLTVMGVGASSTNTYVKDLPLFVAFLVLAIFTYVSGLRAPAAIAFIKDTLIYVFVIVAVFYIPTRLGGWGHIFGTAQTHFAAINPATKKPNGTFIPTSKSIGSTQFDFATLALGSAIALFVYPHIITGTLAAKRRSIVKRNMSLLPAYSVLLGLIALFGYMAVADPVTGGERQEGGQRAARGAVPVPAHVPELVHRDRLRRHHHRRPGARGDHGDRRREPVHPQHLQGVLQAGRRARRWRRGCPSGRRWWSSSARWCSRSSCRTRSPSTCSCSAASGYCRSSRCWSAACSPAGSTAGRCSPAGLAGMIYGTIAAYNVQTPTTSHWAASSDIVFGHTIYIGITAVIINIVIAVVLTLDPQGRQGARRRRRDPPAPVHRRPGAGPRARAGRASGRA